MANSMKFLLLVYSCVLLSLLFFWAILLCNMENHNSFRISGMMSQWEQRNESPQFFALWRQNRVKCIKINEMEWNVTKADCVLNCAVDFLILVTYAIRNCLAWINSCRMKSVSRIWWMDVSLNECLCLCMCA